jgi:hypothetical protein
VAVYGVGTMGDHGHDRDTTEPGTRTPPATSVA